MRLPRNLFIILIPICWALAQVPGAGQALRTTPNGEKIIVYADGTALYFNDLKKVTGLESGDSLAYPVLSVNIESLGEALTPTETDLRRIAERRLALAREALSLAGTRVRAATANRTELENQLAAATQAGNLTQSAALQKRLTLAEKLEEDAQDDEAIAQQKVGVTEAIIEQGRYVEAYNDDRRRRREALKAVDLPRGQDRQLSLLLPKEPNFTGYGPAKGRNGIRSTPPCRPSPAVRASNGAPGKSLTLPFFSYTEPSLRRFLDGEEYLNTTAYTSADAAGNSFLHLTFSFTQPSARNVYGTLPSGTSLSIHLMDGRSLTLDGERESVGIYNHLRQTLNYDVDYPLTRSQQLLLQREAIDFVRVFWSGGFEEYPIHRVDAVKALCRCL